MLEIIDFTEEEIKNYINIEKYISSDSKEQIPEENSQIDIIDEENNNKIINTNNFPKASNINEKNQNKEVSITSNITEKENKNILNLSSIGEINSKLVEFHYSYLIFEGKKYILTNRKIDIKKKYIDQNKYKIYNCQYRRKNEKFRVNKGNFCNSQILLEISNNDNILINNNFKILSTL